MGLDLTPVRLNLVVGEVSVRAEAKFPVYIEILLCFFAAAAEHALVIRQIFMSSLLCLRSLKLSRKTFFASLCIDCVDASNLEIFIKTKSAIDAYVHFFDVQKRVQTL